ncbi:hypothetical protein C8A01DRAFT_32737 [Parachaetomium inaequale]|uniref:Chromo domain-containing protein n=1 Tax=Parachaetomium inaequale TaxID=2588326 RepID=A0AAN6PL76_9PEZI|nr:hypothetical protein C8A01DRAFT_32737 [Parachaetomium inaequale]
MPPASDPDALAMGAAGPQNASSLEDAASSLLDHQPLTGPGKSRDSSPHRPPRGARTCGISSPQSLYLRRYFLAGMALLCALLVAALEILNYFSNREQGFASAPGGMHYYLWRYGPAFVLTIIAAVWGQLEYRIQVFVPWIQLTRGPLPATGNLLLNYVTPWSIISLIRSLSTRHFAVALGISGGIISRVLIVVSTGLLAAETKQLGFDTEFRMVDHFNLSLNAGHYYLNSLADTGVALWANAHGNVPYRPGTTPDRAALSFIPTEMDLDPDVTVSANVLVFSVDQECAAFSWTYPTDKASGDWFSLADIMPQSDFDQLSPFCVWFGGDFSRDPNPALTNNVSSHYINSTILVDLYCPKAGPSPPPTDTARIFTSIGLDLPGNVSTVSALLCHPTYSLTLRQVTTSRGNSSGGAVLNIAGDVAEDMDLGVAPSVLTDDILKSMGGFGTLTEFFDLDLPDFVDLMNLTTPQSDWKAFADNTLFSSAFQQTFRTLAALTVKYTKTIPATDNERVPGRITYKTPRLVVTMLSLRAMEALLAVLALVALLLCLYNFKPLSKNLPSLMTTVMVLAGSSRLAQTMAADRVPSLETFTAGLSGHLFSSSADLRSVQLQVDPQFDDRQMAHAKVPLHDAGHPVLKWWRPTAATKTFRVALIVTTLLLFVTLEVVYQVSNKNGGFADVFTEGNSQYLWLYLPSFSMACLGLAYGALDTATRTLHPYLELSRATHGNRDAMQSDPRSSTALVAVAKTLCRGFFGLSAIISTSMLAGLLIIAASGLYSTTESVSRPESVSLDLESWFDIRSAPQKQGMYGLGVSSPDALTSQAIHFSNLSSPAGAYGEFAFAMLETSGLGGHDHASNPPTTLRARIPAAQTRANCSLYRFWDSIELDPDSSSYGFSLVVPPPPGCTRGDSNAPSDDRYLDLGQGAGKTPPPGYFGFVSNLWWKRLPNATLPGGGFTPDSRTPYTVCSDDTQHLFVIYGRRIDLTMHNVTLLHCLPFVQAVEVDATFAVPSLTVDDTISPPVAIGTPTPWHSTNRSHNSIPLPEIMADESEAVDAFFTILTLGGRAATPLDALTGRDRIAAMTARIDQVYAQLGAQALHFNFRRPMANITATAADPDGRPPPGNGTGKAEGVLFVAPPPGKGRLAQTAVSTRVLEALLLCLAVCGGVSFWVLRGTEELLPADPGSVAARMGLLAGSELVERVRRDGVGAVEGMRVGLGWWERPAFSDEETSDVDMQSSSAKKPARASKPPATSYKEELPEDDDALSADDKNGDAGADNDEEGGDDDDEDLDEEVYVVEKIMSHMVDKGKPLFEVKWEGYDKKSDRTWEPEENLVDNASDALNEYLESIGGREKLYEDSAKALKNKKRSRPSSSTPQASGKRSRPNGEHPGDSEPPLSAKAVTWKPPPGSWENHVAHLDACEDEESGKLMVYLTWKNGHKTQHTTNVIYQRCPQRMLQFYERHVRIIKRDPDADSVNEASQ